ncbi:MAG: putative lipid II flippase FtsW [Candidatus Omnitrophica bacterium]|nr:putative lipid II flippase FtsW [Candidatus Omnitrophota bacterium]MBU4478002.1 putative lipid II flippase FtsW [Candidatus Omnitrophota bacterium]MCG2703935.1 putative lipid II flippase FtsW [Candidatus Omnitrophota bacterium]
MDLRRTRINLAALAIILVCIGIVMIYSASAIYAFENLGDSAYYLKRHIVYVLIGLFFSFLTMSVDHQKLKAMSKPLVLASFVLLILLLIPGIGREVGGARRWFRFGFLSFQPSELAKFAMVVYSADFLSRKKTEITSFLRGFVPVLSVLGVLCLLILVQPDLGTVLAMVTICFIMFFIAGVKITYMISMFLAALPGVYLLIFNVPYRRDRILAFLDPWSDPLGIGFQIIQSLVALGSGGLFGVGLGQGKQKFLYLPAAYTDFIFSIIGEELGFIGTAAIVILLALFLIQATKISLKAKDSFGRLLAFGLVSCLLVEAIVNMGVVTSILPTKGLPFPFISYGGTSLVFNMMYVGLILNIGKNQ